MSEYIKIADFASKKGISKQEAYKIANDPQNKDYVVFEDGIKKIDELDGVEAIWYSDKIYTSKGFSNYE